MLPWTADLWDACPASLVCCGFCDASKVFKLPCACCAEGACWSWLVDAVDAEDDD